MEKKPIILQKQTEKSMANLSKLLKLQNKAAEGKHKKINVVRKYPFT